MFTGFVQTQCHYCHGFATVLHSEKNEPSLGSSAAFLEPLGRRGLVPTYFFFECLGADESHAPFYIPRNKENVRLQLCHPRLSNMDDPSIKSETQRGFRTSAPSPRPKILPTSPSFFPSWRKSPTPFLEQDCFLAVSSEHVLYTPFRTRSQPLSKRPNHTGGRAKRGVDVVRDAT